MPRRFGSLSAGLVATGVLLLLVVGSVPDSFRWPSLGLGLALSATGLLLAVRQARHDMSEIRARMRSVEATLADVAGSVGRQAPVIRRVDDRSRALLTSALKPDGSVTGQGPEVRVVRDLAGARASRAAVNGSLLLVVPRDVDITVTTQIVNELASEMVTVVPEEFLGVSGSTTDEER